MKKILYLMGIDWYWIKQRPQIIAEMLSKDHDITVVYQKEIVRRVALRKSKDELQNSLALPVLPYRDKSRIVHAVQKLLFDQRIRNISAFDMVWIGHPLLYRYVPPSYRGKIVYDCMDNYTALCEDMRIRKTIRQSESKLIKRADLVFVSSSHLKEKIETDYQHEGAVLVRNGFIADAIYRPSRLTERNKVKIGYFGTIAEWIDFSALIKSLEKMQDLEYHFWGPISDTTVPQHPRLFLEGVAEHGQLWDKVKDMDCLIMPFKVNGIIEAVDPVKLYEYISMGKMIIAPYYKEIERFAPYVYFYHNENELINLLYKLQSRELTFMYSGSQQDDFLEDSTWDKRYEIIRENIVRIDGEERCETQ